MKKSQARHEGRDVTTKQMGRDGGRKMFEMRRKIKAEMESKYKVEYTE